MFGCSDKGGSKLLNVSYDPTRELYQAVNEAFVTQWKDQTGQSLTIDQSHAGSGKQARAVVDGLEADVVTLALAYDIEEVAKANLMDKDWYKEFPNNSAPYTSTIIFLVRKGNPLGIKDWDDLVKKGVSIVTPNPKTSGGARWNYLAAWAFAERKFGPDKARDFVASMFKNVAVLDSGARGSTTTFMQREIGDVFLTWENEAHLAIKEFGADKVEIVIPSVSILAEPPVAIVDKNVTKHGTGQVARAYLDFLYTDQAQEIIAKNYYRPRNKEVMQKYIDNFPSMTLVTIDDFGGWDKAQKEHFADGGVFDSFYKK
jgi:sulfate transport system substrate-binding protein